jgi:hypothetical protein
MLSPVWSCRPTTHIPPHTTRPNAAMKPAQIRCQSRYWSNDQREAHKNGGADEVGSAFDLTCMV